MRQKILVEQFVDIDTRSMTVIEDERVPQRLRFQVVRLIIVDQRKQLLVEVICLLEVGQYPLPRVSIKQRHFLVKGGTQC